MQDSGLKVCAQLRMPKMALGVEQNFRLGLRELKNHFEDSQYLDSGLMVSTAVPWNKHKANLHHISRIINAEGKEPGGKNINMAKSILLHTQKSVSIAQTFGDFCNIDGEHLCCTGHYFGYFLAQ